MAVMKNISPKGDLDVPALGRMVKKGETVQVPDGLHLPPTDFEEVSTDDHAA